MAGVEHVTAENTDQESGGHPVTAVPTSGGRGEPPAGESPATSDATAPPRSRRATRAARANAAKQDRKSRKRQPPADPNEPRTHEFAAPEPAAPDPAAPDPAAPDPAAPDPAAPDPADDPVGPGAAAGTVGGAAPSADGAEAPDVVTAGATTTTTTDPRASAARTEPAHAASGAADAGRPNEREYRPRHARHRHRWPWAVGVLLVVVLLAAAATVVMRRSTGSDTDDVATPNRTVAPAATNPVPAPAGDLSGLPSGADTATGGSGGEAGVPMVDCLYTKVRSAESPKLPPARPTRGGPVTANVSTNRGPITLELNATAAPCTVLSFLTLAANGYFTDTACHRVTTQTIFVLQCGDPTATGSGGPGYTFNDENLPPAGATVYPMGSLAMANSGPNTNGGQFFMVYRDSPIDPNYPVFGRITAGIEVLMQVAAAGAPNNDGPPNLELVIESVEIV